MARYTLYGTPLSGSVYKIALMFSLAGEKFDFEHVNLRKGETKDPEFLKKNRYGQVPCLVDHDKSIALCQSGSILMYLADTTGRFAGASEHDRIRIREWLFWDYDRLVPNVYRPRGFRLGFPNRNEHESTINMYMRDGNDSLNVLETVGFNGRQWLVGESPSIADIAVFGVASYAPQAGYELSNYPNVSAWLVRMRGLPGFGTPEELIPKESRRA